MGALGDWTAFFIDMGQTTVWKEDGMSAIDGKEEAALSEATQDVPLW